MMMPTGKEQRASKRIDSQLFISYSLQSEDGLPNIGGMGMATNISARGLRLEARTAISQGTNIELILAVGEETIKVLGNIRYSKETDEGYVLGIEFVELSETALELISTYYPEITD
jgi:hypothetical protein